MIIIIVLGSWHGWGEPGGFVVGNRVSGGGGRGAGHGRCYDAAAGLLSGDEEGFVTLRGRSMRGPGVNCAAVRGPAVAVADHDLDSWRRLMSVNLDGVFLCLRGELRVMRGSGGGAIVNLASVLGLRGHPAAAAYATAKHAVIGL